MADDRSIRDEISDGLTVGSYRFGSILSKFVPGALSSVVGSAVGMSAALGMREKRRIVERHMRRLCPDASAFEIRRLSQSVFDSYARYYLESFKLPALSRRQVDASFTIDGFVEHVQPAIDAGSGAIVALPHLGGWEWAGRWATDRGFKMSVVVEPLSPPELFDWFADLRRKFGMTIIPLGPDAGAACLRALRHNEILCLLCDRYIDGGGAVVELFGERTLLPAGPATLAIRTGAPLVPAAVYFSDSALGHHAIVRPPLDTARGGRLRDDVTRVTQALAHELERLIMRAPEQWHLLQPNWPSDPGYPHVETLRRLMAE